MPVTLLGSTHIHHLARTLGVRPSKQRGQNFVIDPGTIRRIVNEARIDPGSRVLEIGPGLGSLTLGLLEADAGVTAVEIEPAFAEQLPLTVSTFAPEVPAKNLSVIRANALDVRELPEPQPTALVANLPYNVAVPVLLTALERFETLGSALVMVQAEVADRLVARPGSRTYGVPSVKAAWYGEASRAGSVGRQVFWPVPGVDSALVRLVRHAPPGGEDLRRATFCAIDAAFAQRRKTLRAALAGWAGGGDPAERILRSADIDPQSRGERLVISDFVRLARVFQETIGQPQ